MKHNYLPSHQKECRHVGNELCLGELNYYKESPPLDLYYCDKCYKITEWDGIKLKNTEYEAYPNRDRTPTSAQPISI